MIVISDSPFSYTFFGRGERSLRVATSTNPRTHTSGQNQATRSPSKKEWLRLTTPEEKRPVDPGSKSERETFQSMNDVREAAQKLDFHPLNAFVASVAGGVDARSVDAPDREHVEELEVSVKDYYSKPVKVEMGLHNGPDAPMLMIYPGIYGSRDGGFPKAFKKIALERGMNYAIVPNPLNPEMLDGEPDHHPSNIQIEAEIMHAVLRQLRGSKPEYFDQVSLAGYSYGALLAANVAKYDELRSEHEGRRMVQGGVVALSPPQNLFHSMLELDSLREGYEEGAGSTTATGVYYTREVSKYGYENFMESKLAERGEGENATEMKIADEYGSREEMKDMVVQVDEQFGHNHLPPKWPDYFKRKKVINEMTYDQYSAEWFSKDPWLVEEGLTPEQLAADNSFKAALDELDHTPVLTLLSQDDYILNQEDVDTFRQLEKTSNGLEYTRVMDHGGHVGLIFNPEVQEIIGDFAFSAEGLKD